MKCQPSVKYVNHQLSDRHPLLVFMVLTRDIFIEPGFFGADMAFRKPAEVSN